jgi:GH24 family phage-related lysozyme (muramidase)
MTQNLLGRLERVELRRIWSSDFTPWLTREDNLRLLAGEERRTVLCRHPVQGHGDGQLGAQRRDSRVGGRAIHRGAPRRARLAERTLRRTHRQFQSGELSETKQLQHEFWTGFRRYMETLADRTGFDRLRPNAQAALLSVTFNHGASTRGPRRIQMRNLVELSPKRDYEGNALEFCALALSPWRRGSRWYCCFHLCLEFLLIYVRRQLF